VDSEKVYKSKYYAKNREKILAKAKEKRDPEYFKEYYAKNKEKILAKAKERRRAHPEKTKAYNDSRKEIMREYFREYARKWRAENPEAKREQNRKRKESNPEAYAEMLKRSYERHCINLSDYYVRRVIMFGNSLKHSDIPQSMVEAKRIQIQIQREIKNAKRNRAS